MDMGIEPLLSPGIGLGLPKRWILVWICYWRLVWVLVFPEESGTDTLIYIYEIFIF
jgi:hypothetical protein